MKPVIRKCVSVAELDACVAIQEEVWGYEERDIIPRRLFVVAQRIGGQVFGAFDPSSMGDPAEAMIGFAMALPGLREGMPYLHSHMLAVRPEWRNSGIGRSLKLAQREEALSRGIRLMEWTFDPLEIKNAFLNIARLGATVRSYTPNFYGQVFSALQGGLETDRMHAEWWMDSERVVTLLDGRQPSPVFIEQEITVPAIVADWKRDPQRVTEARALQIETRGRFVRAFRDSLAVVGFRKDATGDGIYQLGRAADPQAGFGGREG